MCLSPCSCSTNGNAGSVQYCNVGFVGCTPTLHPQQKFTKPPEVRINTCGVLHPVCDDAQGAAVAIDSAVPRREDAGPLAALGDANYPGLAAAMNIIDLVSRCVNAVLS